MAKNWTLKEAVEVITAGKNKEAIQELGKRYPITAIAIASLAMSEGLKTLMSAMPEHVTMLKIERALKDGVADTEAEDEDEGATEEAVVESSDVDLEAMTKNELYELCVKRGIKAQKHQKPKAYYIELLKTAGNVGAIEEDEAEEEAEEEVGDSYEDMSAVDLFKLCKKRGIKAEPKKKAAVYIKLLEEADAADAAGDEEDDDWGDEEKEKPVAKKSAKKAEKPAKKEAAEAAEEDEDDDWDI